MERGAKNWRLFAPSVLRYMTPCNAQSQQALDGVTMFLSDILFPIIVALIAYLIVDRLGEYRKRRLYSKLGVAVIETLLEEVNTGIRLLSMCYKMVKTNQPKPPSHYLPTGTWSGTSTIQDEVLLRIISTSSNRHFAKGFPPKECLIHCKNYFENICGQYNDRVKQANGLGLTGAHWRDIFLPMLARTNGKFVLAAKNVQLMLEHAKELLEENSEKWFPK